MTTRPSLTRLVLVSCFLAAVPQAFAIQNFQPVSPEELQMTGDPAAPGAAAIILFRQVDRDDNGRTSHEDSYFRIKILKEEGRKYADVEVPFLKDREDIVNIKARTIRPDGSIVNFDGKVFNKMIVKSRGVKVLAKTFTLPEVQTSCIIEYLYTDDLKEHYIFDSHWILSDELFTKRAKFSLKPYETGYFPLHLRWSWNYLPPNATKPEQGPDHIVRMEAQNIPAFQTEDFMPPENELKARVDFIYSEEAPGDQIDEFWKKVDKKRNSTLENFIGKRKAMEQALAQIVSPSDSPEVKLQKIYAKVQQLRNTSYEVAETEEEQKRNKEKPATNVEDVWKAGYGDGQQLTWLFLALARAAGLEAYGVWVSDRRNYFFKPELLDDSKLNSNVAVVKLNGKDVYFDPGAAFTPFSLLPWSETGVRGLRLDKDGGTWVQTTLPDSSASQIDRKANFRLVVETGGLEGKVTVTYTGLEAMRRRVEERNEDDTDRKKYLEDDLKDFIPVGCDVELTSQPDWKSSSSPLVAEFDVKIPGWATAAGRRALIPVGVFTSTEKHVFDHANRVHPIYFEFPFQKEDDITIQLPSGWEITNLPAPKNQDGHVIVYTSKAQKDNNILHLTRSLKLDVLLLETKYYSALRNFFQTVRTGDEEQIMVQPGSAKAGN